MSRAAVFLDRDGTMIEDVNYLDRIERIRFFPSTIDAVRALSRAGFRIVVVTNQSGVARGYFSEATVRDVHAVIDAQVAAGGGRIDAYYHCPHHPEGTVAEYRRVCDCRKPARALVDRAAADLDLDIAKSFVVGDQRCDLELARRIGARAVFVRRENSAARGPVPAVPTEADAVVDDLAAAASWILMHR